MKIADFFVALRIKDDASKPIEKTAQGMQTLFTKATAVKIALVGMVYGFKKMADSTANLSFQLDNLDARGINSDKIFKLGKIAEQNGSSFDEMAASAKAYSSVMAQALLPGGRVPQALYIFGVKRTDAFETALDKIKERLKTSTDLSRDFAFVSQLGIAENIFRMMQKGVSFDTSGIAGITKAERLASQDIAKTQAKLMQSLDRLGKSLIESLAPTVTDLVEEMVKLSDILKPGMQWVSKLLKDEMPGGSIVGGVKQLVETFPDFMNEPLYQKTPGAKKSWDEAIRNLDIFNLFTKPIGEDIGINNKKGSQGSGPVSYNFNNTFNVSGSGDPGQTAKAIKRELSAMVVEPYFQNASLALERS